MTLAAQIIDQQVSGVVERHSDAFAGELRLDALAPLFRDRDRTLQRLSATFRRADLVDTLLEASTRDG